MKFRFVTPKQWAWGGSVAVATLYGGGGGAGGVGTSWTTTGTGYTVGDVIQIDDVTSGSGWTYVGSLPPVWMHGWKYKDWDKTEVRVGCIEDLRELLEEPLTSKE